MKYPISRIPLAASWLAIALLVPATQAREKPDATITPSDSPPPETVAENADPATTGNASAQTNSASSTTLDAASPAADPAATVRDELARRITAARNQHEKITADLTVISEIGSVEAQLREARMLAEQQKLGSRIKTLKSAKHDASLASKSLGVCEDKERIRSIYQELQSKTEMARLAVRAYETNRTHRIALVEARTPAGITGAVSLEMEATEFLRNALDAMDGTRKADFLALVYAVAASLDVRIPQTLDNGKTVRIDYANVMDRAPEIESQMALVTLMAYNNRQKQRTGGTIFGRPLDQLVSAKLVVPGRGRTYRVSPQALDAYLLAPVKKIWEGSDLSIGGWDLSKSRSTAAAMDRFSTGEFQIPDQGLLMLLGDIKTVIGKHVKDQAMADAQARFHSSELSEAKWKNLEMEQAAGAIFQAEALEKRQGDRLAKLVAGYSFFVDEAARLAAPSAKTPPRTNAIRSHANALNQVAISVGRAIRITQVLDQHAITAR